MPDTERLADRGARQITTGPILDEPEKARAEPAQNAGSFRGVLTSTAIRVKYSVFNALAACLGGRNDQATHRFHPHMM